MKSQNDDQQTPVSPEPSRNLLPGNGLVTLGSLDVSGSRPNSLSSSMNVNGFLKALRRHWLLATSLGLLCAVLSAAGAKYFLPPGKLTAQVRLHVDSIPPAVFFREVHSSANFDTYQRSQTALVKSRLVLLTALRQPEVRQLSLIERKLEKGGEEEVINWLEKQIKADFSVGPEILRISMDGDSAENLKILVTAVENAYLKEIVQKDRIAAEKHLNEMIILAKKYEEDLKRKRKWLADISKPLGTDDPAAIVEIRKFNEAYLSRTRMELMDVRSDLRKLEEEAAGLLAHPEIREPIVSERAIDDVLRNDPAGKGLLEKKQRIESNIQDAQGILKEAENSPYTRKFRQELEGVDAELAALRKNIRPQLAKDLAEKNKLEAQTSQDRLKQRMNFLKSWEARLEKDVNRLQKESERIGKTTLDIGLERADLSQFEELSKQAARQVEALKVEQNAPLRITHLEDAYVIYPDEQKRKLMASGGAGLGALALVLFGIAWYEFCRQRVKSADEVVQGLGINLMGTVPVLPSRRQLRLINSNDQGSPRWQSIFTESVDTARTLLLHRAASESLRVIMVTSAVAGEGKTSLSSHLAASLARAGRKTLLLDADFRNPAIHRLFGLEQSPGLCELLREEISLAEAIQPTPASGLSLITAGRCDELALKRLAQNSLQKICEPLRAEFDFIVVDSAPILPVADSLLVGQFVDGVIFSILHDVSRLPKVYAAHKRLEILGIHVLGAVVSGANVDDYSPAYQQYEARVHA